MFGDEVDVGDVLAKHGDHVISEEKHSASTDPSEAGLGREGKLLIQINQREGLDA